jgi:cation transport regulator ChaB
LPMTVHHEWRTGMSSVQERSRETGIPQTILRSDRHAQKLWKETHDSAVETYGEGGRAHRVAYASLKHEYEKKGDRWVRKN